MSQNQNKHLQQQQQLEHHQLQQQQHHHHQQQLLHHHHQQQHQQQQQRQWHQQYQQQQQQLHHHHQQQQQQQQAQYAAAAAAHAHVAAATGMRSGNGMPGMFGNTLGRGGCLYDTSGGSLVGGGNGGGGGVGGFDLDMAGHHIGSGNASAITATSTAPAVGVGIAGGGVGGYLPSHVNVSSVAGGAYNAGMSGMPTSSESGRRTSVGGCAYTQASQSQPQPPPQQPQQQLQQHTILPPERIKMEPLEQILTPTIEMEELIIKTEPTDDAYNKVSTVDEAIATGSTNMNPNAGYMNFPKHLQPYPQHQQQQQQQQLLEHQKQRQKLQHQQHALQQQQHLHQQQHQHLQQQQQLQQQHQQQQREQQLQQQMLSHDAMAEAGLLTVKLEPQIHIKEEMPEASQNKPLNFPRRKVQTERSDTLPICQRCKQVFFKKQSYSKHVSQSLCEIVEYDFKCSICPMSFTSSEELQTHEQLHRENMYFCHKYCGKYFDTIELCEVHEYMQHEYVNYICNVCSAGFASRDLLFAHMPQHRNQPRYDCPVCRLWFHTGIQLHQHRIQAPYFCGKFYRRAGAAAPAMPAGGAPFGPVPPTHSANYNLQDCSMGIIEMPNSNSFSSYLQNRAFHHQHPAPPHPPLPPQQMHPHLAQQQQQQHLQRQQQQLHLQQQHSQYPTQPLHAAPQQPQPTPAQPDFMRRNSITGATGSATTEFQMPQIKTEIKVEPDLYPTPDYPLQTPLPPPPLPPPPLGAAQQSALVSPSRQRSRFGDFTNESFGAGGASGETSHAFGTHNNSSGSNGNSNDFSNSNTSSLQRSNSNDNNGSNHKPSAFPVGNFHFPTTPAVSRTRVVDTGEDGAVCCVPHCGVTKQSSPTLQFFTFPKDEKYLHQWLHNLKMFPEPDSTYSQYRICSLHFPKRCINRYSLCYWAVPTFNLGHDDVANLYQNREITNTFTVGERAQCSMPGCPSQRGESNCKFYNFPNDMKTRIKWCQNARLPVNSREPRHFCSRHFEDRCFGKFRLKPWAVPTLHLGTPYGRIHDNPGVFYLEEKKCCLPHCKRTRSSDFNLSLYRFPRDEVLLRRWCYNLRLDPAIYRGKNHKICSAHFIKEALGLRKLSPGAVPTLNLGHNDRFNIYENELPTPPVVPPSKMFNFHNVSAPPPVYSSHRHSIASSSSHSERLYPNPVSKLKFSISNITAGDVSSMSGSATQNILDSLEVCFVPSCKRNRNIDNVTLHTIPRRPEQMRKWCHNLKIGIETLHKGVRICSAHFEPYCIGGCMRPFAVPTLNLGHDDPNIYRNPDVIKKLNIRETCCVQDCKRNRDRDHANLHRFPSNFEMLTKWCENLLKPVPDGTKLFNDAICEVHFEERCIRNKRLEKWAVPTVKLGHAEEPKYRLPTDDEIAEQWPKPLMPNKGIEEGECCVSTCRRDPKIDDVKLYRTPEDPELLAKWAHNLQTETEDLTTLRICNLHFEEICFSKKRRLHYWSLPTLNLATNVEQLYENPEPLVPQVIIKSETKRERRRMRDSNEPLKPWTPRCCLPHCRKRRDTDHVQLFRFPVLNRPMLAKWCHNLQLPQVGNGHRRLCSTHFEPRVLSKRCPIPMSVPTLDLNTPPGYKIYMNPARLKAVKLQQVCCISSCSRTRADGVQLFRFPHSRSVLRKWCHNTRQHARGEYRVCSRHFEPHAFGAKRLMPGAIPTLNLDPEVEDVYANEAQSFAETQCVVSGCVASKELDGVRLFKFPSDDVDLLWKWCNNLKMNPVDCRGVRICNRHFEPECVGSKMLYKWAVPTLALGHNDADIKLVSVPPPEARYSDVVTKCCVPTCGKSRKFDDAQMNSFPKNLRLFRCWKHNLKLDFLDFKDREKYKICSDHFESVCLGKLRLNYGAIPTLNLGHDDTDDLYPVDPAQIQVSLFGKMRPRIASDKDAAEFELAGCVGKDDIKCSYPNCTATKMLLSEPYDMPAALPLHALWCAQMKVDAEALSETPKLCGLHFIKLHKATLDAANALAEGDNELSEAMKSLNDTYEKCCASPIVCSAQCCVAGCGSNQVSGSRTAQRLYLFPTAVGSGIDLLEKWCHNVDVSAADLSRFTHKVCARHFEAQCIGPTQRLRSWAIPTLQLQQKPEHKIHAIPELGSAARPHEARCCVATCARERGDFETMRLFSFPIIDEVLEKWLHNLQLTRSQCARLRICEQHFEPRCIVKTRLLRWAVPTLLLARNTEELLQNEPPVQAAAPAAPTADEVDAIDAASNIEGDEDMRDVDDEEDDNDSGELATVPNVKMKKSLGIFKCCVPSCRRTRLQHGVRLFQFPTSHQILRKWCHNLKISLEKASDPALRICSVHFHKRCIDGKELRPWAKPTNALGHSGPIYENPKNLPGVFLPKCCLAHCRQRRTLENDLRTFGFPKDEALMRKWCANLRMEPRANHARICMSHFPPEAMGNKKLRANAVPTLNLGHNEPLEYDNALLIATAMKARNPLEEKKVLTSDASDTELGNIGEYDDEMDDEDNDDDDDYRIDEEDDENDFYASAGVGNSDEEEEETVEDFTPSISAATGDDDELCSNTEARDADNFIVDSADEDEEGAEVEDEDEEDIYGNEEDDDEDDSEESDESVTENIYNSPAEEDESDSESEVNADNNNADSKDAEVDDDDVEMLIDADEDEDDKSSYNACDPLDFVECVNQSDDTQQNEAPATSTKVRNLHKAGKNTPKRPITLSPTNYEDDSNTNYSNADETTRFTATTSNSASATTSSASASAAATSNAPTSTRHCGADKINRSVFRLCCLRHRRKKKAPPDPPPDMSCAHAKAPAVHRTLMNSIARPRRQRAYCAVRRCGRTAGAAVTLYRFPLSGSRYCRRWCAQLKIKMTHTSRLRICQRHFPYSLVDRRRRRLRFGAIPTRNLYNTTAQFKRNPLYGLYKNATKSSANRSERAACADTTQTSAAQLNVYNRCCVPHCGKSHQVDGVTLFRFPKLRSLYLQWATNLRLMPTMRLVQVYKVCSEHFEPQCLSYQRKDRANLKYGSVPTLKLGHNDTSKIYKQNTLLPQKRRGLGRRKWYPQKGVNECAVHDCKVAQFLQMQLFALPATLKLQERWCNYFKLNFTGASKDATDFFENVRLCALHYMEGYQMATYSDGARKGSSAALDELEANYARITSSTRIQMLKCCVPNCSTKFTDNVRLTAFPSAEELRAKWQHNTQVSFSPSHRYLYKVCALHFEERCFAKKRLFMWAIPTLHLPRPQNQDTEHKLFENPIFDSVSGAQCCIEDCATNRVKQEPAAANDDDKEVCKAAVRFWHFPQDDALREKWCHNLGLSALTNEISHTSRRWRICSRHFEQFCIGKTLRSWAVPTLHLPKPVKHAKSGRRSTYIYQNPDSAAVYYRCCIKTCHQMRDLDAGIRLYAFPKKETMLQKWAHNIRMPAVKCRYARICTLHFEAQCLRPQMQSWALPTIDLGHDEADIFRVPKVKLMVTNERCCLPHCSKRRSRDNVHLFTFPRDKDVLDKWWHNLAIGVQDVKRRLICESHFESRCISKRRLKRWAIPTLHLGHTNDTLKNPTPAEVASYENNTTARRSQTPSKMTRAKSTQPTAPTSTLQKCSIAQCARGADSSALYRFPKPDWLRKKWCDNTRIDEETAKQAKICARHFEPHVMGNRKPRPWALPTMELGADVNGAPLPVVHANPKQLSRFHPEEHEWGELRYVRANHCSIISCLKSKKDGVTLFNYPTKRHMLQKWAENCRHYPYQAKRYRFQLCGAHFTADCFKREGTRLRKGSVPTLNLGHDDAQIHQSEFESVSAIKIEMKVLKSCSVPQCGRTNLHDGVRLFKFPYERAETLEKWCHNLRMNAADCRNALICNMHFEPRCVGGGHRGLLLRAIPTLLLGHNDSDILNNPETFERPEKLISCCVPGCTNTKQTEGITLSAFPKLRSHFEKWAHNLQLPVSTTIWHTYKVCSAHFESYCYEHGRIKVGAMPTLKLGHSNAIDLYTVSEETMSQAFKRKRVAPKTETPKTPHEACCYPECREMELRLTNQLFEFPRLDNIRRAWYESVGLSAEEQAEEAGGVAIENETQKTAPDNGMPQASDAAAAAATAPVKVTKISPKLCPMHFKLLYIEHAALLDTLKSDSTADTQRILHKLDETYTKVCDISCVRRISCAVPGCNSNYLTTKSLKFFKFPDNAEMRAKWCHNTQVIIDPDRLYCYKICELHFEASCSSQLSKKMQRLKSWALPTLQLPPRAADAPEIYALPAPDTLAETKRASLLLNAPLNKCCIASCVYAKAPAERAVSADSEIQFFNFPNDAELLYKWVYNTQISMVAATNARICSLHFEKHCINKRLRMYAVPTLLLGHQKTDIYKNPSDKRVAAEAIESKPPKLPKYYEDNVADDVEVEEEDEEEDEDDDDDDDDDDVLLADVKAHKMKLKKSDITKYKPEVLDENEAGTVLKSAAHDEKKLDRALLEPMLVVKTEFKERKEVITTTTTNKTATQPKPYHQPFIINIKQEKDIEENYTAEGIENQMKQGLLDMFNSFGDTGAEQEPDDINELGDEVTQMERDTARHCRIVGCNSYARNAGVTLFKFPFPLDQFRKWLHNTQLEVDYTRRWRYRICHRHFEPICMQFRKLPPGTMPTLNLGPKRPAHIYENEFDVNSLSKYKTKPQQQNLTTTTTSNMFSELNDEADTSSSFAAPTHHNNDNIDPNADYNDDYADFVDNTPIDRDTSRHCRIPDCNSHAKDPGVTLFKFPMSEYLFHKWLYNTQLKVDYTRRWRYRICQRHFEPICMQFRKLPPGTMPTLNLGPSRPERIYENSFDINHLKKFKTKLKNNTTTTSTAIAPTSTSAITHSSHADYTDDLETSSSYAVDANVSNTAQLPLLSCTVRHCTSQYHALHEGLHLHKLPTNIMLREKWIYNCRFSEETLISMSSRIRICSLHFTPNCYYGVKRQLKFGSVPTLRLGHTDPNIYPHGFSNESEAQMAAKQHTAQHNWRTKRLQSSTDANQDICCLINCRHSSREYTRHFAFPSERELLDQWLNALGMEFNSSRPDDYKICEWHFKASDFDGEVLRADAVPTRNLKIDDANQTDEEDDNEDEDDDVVWNANEEPLDERPSTSAAAAAAASTTTPDGYNKLIPGSRRCCLAHCRKQLFQDNVRTFKFPTMHEQFEKWVHNLGIKYDGDAPWRYQICSEHFENQCIIHYENKAKLFRWAVPTLKLGKHAPAILFTNENPKKLQQRDADYERVYRNSNAGGYADNIDNEETMDTTNDELSSTAPPADAPKHMAYQQEDMDLLAPIERPPHKMSSATKRSNYAYTASNDDGDDYYDGDDDAYDMGDGENSLLNVIREEKPSAVKEGTPVSSFFSLQLVRGGSAKVRACCLPHCGRTRESGVRLFRFPTEPVFLKRWEYNLRVLFNESQRNTHLICSAHFERGQYNKRLVVDAIPTLNLGHNSNDIYRNGQYEPTRMHKRTLTASPPRIPSANSLPLSSHKPLYCNVPACADTQSKRRLYPFPSNHGFVKIWAERTQIAYDARHHAELRVCELHFETDCFSAHGLNNNAVPTLFLPAPNALPTPAAIAPVAPTKIPPPIGRSTAASTTMPKLSAITCSVTNCNNSTATRTDLKIFSKFPDDFELFTKWCFNLKIDPRTYVDGSYNVCSEHFEPFCIGGHSLRVWAVPTLRLGHNSKLIHSVERPAEMETKCCLPHCGRKKSKDGVEFYSFPKGDIYRQWCQILKIDEGLYRNTDKKICSAHFRADCFNSNGTLRLGARPTMLLRNRTATAAAHMLKPPAPYRSKCIVRICHEMQQLYSFPAQRNLCTKWCHNLKIDYYPKLHENMNFKICRRHFEPNCLLSGGKLHAEAVPTVQLGHSDVNIYQNLVGIKHSASTTSYDDNSSLRTSVSTVHTWLMDVDAETNAANNMPPVSSVDAGTGGVGVGAGATAVADDDMVRMEYEPPVDLEPTVVTENIADDNLDLTNSAYMQMEDDTYYADFEEQRLLPQSSTFIAAESAEVIDLDAVDAVQEQFPSWSQDDAVLVDDDDEEEDDDALLWPLN